MKDIFFSIGSELMLAHAQSPAAKTRERRTAMVGIGLGILAFAAYVGTLCPGVFPGVSSVSCAGVLRVLPGSAVIGHPLWLYVARLAAAIPIGDLPVRLNLFSALCGAAAVALLFSLTTQILFAMLSEEGWSLHLSPNEDECLPGRPESHLADEASQEQSNEAHHCRAMAGGAVTALAFAFCVPFWSASVSLHAQTFDLLFLLIAGHALSRYAFTGSPVHLFAAAFLCGMGLVESVAFVVLLPVFLVIIFRTGIRHGQISDPFIVLLLAGLGTGLLLAGLSLVIWATLEGAGLSGAALLRIGSTLVAGHIAALAAGLPRNGWILVVVQSVVPALTVFLGGPRSFFYTRDILSRWSWVAVNAIFTGLVALALLNLPGSPWWMARAGTYLPVMPLLCVAMTCGGLFVYCLLLVRKPNLAEIHDETVSPLSRIAGMVLAATIALLVLVAPFRNFADADGRRGAFAADFCRELIGAAPQARCFVTDGTFDANLLVQARILQRHIVLLSDRPPKPPAADDSHPLKAAPAAFDIVREWLRKNVGGADQVAFLTSPGLWPQAGFQAVPDLLLYRGEKQPEKIDAPALLARHLAFWLRIEPILVADPSRIPSLRRFHRAMRMHASKIANDLGVLCLYKSALQEADEAFRHAQTLDENNLCAFLNQYALHLGHPEIGSADELRKRMVTFAVSQPLFGSMAEQERSYGALHRPSAERLVNRYIAEQMPQNPNREIPPIIAQLIEYCRASVQSDAVPRLMPPPRAKSVPDKELAAAVRAVRGGYWKAAEAQLRGLTQKRRNQLSVLALLAEVLMNTGRFDEVQNEILPAMSLAADGKDLELIDMTEGCLALRHKEPDYATARACFIRALQRNPDIEEAQNQLLQASLALGDMVRIESDCTNLLARTPGQPLANAMLGSLRLSQGRLEDAETALNASIAVRPVASTLNDLAETLRRAQRYADAEAAARRAILLTPDFYQAWDTLANILIAEGRLDEADGPMKCALALGTNDLRLYLTLACLRIGQGRFQDARQTLDYSKPLLSQTTPFVRDEYAKLRQQMESGHNPQDPKKEK